MKQKKRFICAIILVLVFILSGCGSLLTIQDTATARQALTKMDQLLSGELDSKTGSKAIDELKSAAGALSASASTKENKARKADHNKAKLYEKAAYPQMAAEAIEGFISSWRKNDISACQEYANDLRILARKTMKDYKDSPKEQESKKEDRPETGDEDQTAYTSPAENTVTPDGDAAYYWYIADGGFTVKIMGAFTEADPGEGDPDLGTSGDICLDDYSKILQIWVGDRPTELPYTELSDDELDKLVEKEKSLISSIDPNVEAGIFRSDSIIWIWDTSYDSSTEFFFYIFTTVSNGKYITFQFSFLEDELSASNKALCEEIISSLEFMNDIP